MQRREPPLAGELYRPDNEPMSTITRRIKKKYKRDRPEPQRLAKGGG
jgi:hypothetical protein